MIGIEWKSPVVKLFCTFEDVEESIMDQTIWPEEFILGWKFHCLLVYVKEIFLNVNPSYADLHRRANVILLINNNRGCFILKQLYIKFSIYRMISILYFGNITS